MMKCQQANKAADPFSILGLDIDTCEFPDIAKRYRKIVLLLHPDKCKLPNAAEAFKIVEKAYRTIPDEGILQRLKIAHQRKKEREAKLKNEAAARAAKGSSGNLSGGVDNSNLSKEERIEQMRQATREDEAMEAARKAQEAAAKKAKHEKKLADDAALSAVLERQIREEAGMHLF